MNVLGNEFSWQGLFDPGGFTKGEKPTPNQYQDQSQLTGLYNGGLGDPNAAWWSQDVTHQQAPQAGYSQLQLGNDPFRNAQLQQMGQLQGIASGQQQGAGELAAQRQIGQAQAAQQGMARMARGGNAALAYRNAANQSAALGSTGAGMGQQAALQDQQAAQGMLGQVGAQGRGADINVANANAGYQQQTGLANAAMQMQNQQQNAGNYLQILNQLNQANQNKYNADLGIGSQRESSANAKQGGLISGIGAAIASDERLKTDVTDARGDIDKMLDGLRGPVGWKYLDEKYGTGRWDGVMAQDMEKSEAGRRVVRDTPEGKMLDIPRAVSTNLAASARLHERLRKLEDEYRAKGAKR